MESAGTPLPQDTLDSVKRNGVALKGPITTPIGTGLSLRQRRAAARARPLRVRPALQDLPGRPLPLRRGRPRRRAREHRGPLRRDRVRGRHGRRARRDRVPQRSPAEADPRHVRDLDQAAEPGGLGADHPLRVRLRARQRAPPRLVHHEGEHHEVHRRPLSRRLPRGRPGLPRDRGLGDARRRALHGARAAARRSSTCSSCRTSTATSSATSPPASSAASGVAPGANIGTEAAVFEATHGSAPKYKGQNRVNPTAMILSGKLMLEHLGERDAARAARDRGRGRDRRRRPRDLRPEADA